VRRRSERGAALVETAIVLPLLLLVVGGIIEFGVGFQQTAAVAAAARAGARAASAEPKQDQFAASAADAASTALRGAGTDAPVAVWVFRARPGTSSPQGRLGSCSECIGYPWDPSNLHFDTTRVLAGSSPWQASAQNACAGQGDEVGVAVELDHRYLFGVFGRSRRIVRTAVMRLEPFVGGAACSGS